MPQHATTLQKRSPVITQRHDDALVAPVAEIRHILGRNYGGNADVFRQARGRSYGIGNCLGRVGSGSFAFNPTTPSMAMPMAR